MEILDFLLTESTLYISDELKNHLKNNSDNISTDLLSAEGRDIDRDITFLDINDKAEIVFIPMRSIKHYITTNYDDETWEENNPEDFNPENYQRIKGMLPPDFGVMINPGRLINNVFGKDAYKPVEIEQFANKMKSIEVKEENFKILKGNDILDAFKSDNFCDISDRNQLSKSCMNNKPVAWFDIYTKNDNCSLLALYNEKGDIIARALIWLVERMRINDKLLTNVVFMDRVYTTKDSDYYKFIKYANDNNIYTRTANTFTITDGVSYKGEEFMDVEMKTSGPKNLEQFPYMDTFKAYNPENGALLNFEAERFLNELDDSYLYLESEHGGAIDIQDQYVYSLTEEKFIMKDGAVHVEDEDDWVSEFNAIQIEDDEDIVYFYKDGDAYGEYNGKYYRNEDLVYSVWEKAQIPKNIAEEYIDSKTLYTSWFPSDKYEFITSDEMNDTDRIRISNNPLTKVNKIVLNVVQKDKDGKYYFK